MDVEESEYVDPEESIQSFDCNFDTDNNFCKEETSSELSETLKHETTMDDLVEFNQEDSSSSLIIFLLHCTNI